MSLDINNFGMSQAATKAYGPSSPLGSIDAKNDGIGKASVFGENLVISEKEIDVGDVPEIDIPDSALAKDDRLGKLVTSLFNLPAPPMPELN